MPWCIFGDSQGSLFVGGHEDAVDWAEEHAEAVINCADIDYPHAESCRRRWLNINYRGRLNGRDWNQRMRAVLTFLLECLVREDCVLIHCRVGRHRSGLFAVLALMFVLGLSWDEACDVYFEKRIGLTRHDMSKVRGHRLKQDLLALRAKLQHEGFCDDQLKKLRRPAGSGVPARSRSPSRSRSRSPPQNWDERAWQCPRCESMNHRSLMFCASWDCRESRPLMQQKLPGDWFCSVCGNHNYERRRSCNNTHCETMQHKPGDWHCPACGNHNFAVRTVCNKKTCRARRPRSS